MPEETNRKAGGVEKFEERKKLFSYHMLDEIESFFEEIDSISEQYEYITAAERRAFNLAAWYMSDISKLISNSGLLLQYKKLADHYKQCGCFPRLLVVDDLMMHGRGMSKFLNQLETLVRDELGYNDWDDHKQTNCRRSFTDSIDIFVYAKNSVCVLLDSRFTWNMRARKKMPLHDLRDLSLQLSDFISHNSVANTSFVPTFFSQSLSGLLEKEEWANGINDQKTVETGDMKWYGVRWKYLSEDMLLFLGFYGQKQTNRISAIRFFPGRKKGSDRFSSFSMLPDLPKRQFYDLCGRVDAILKQYQLEKLSSILSEDDPILQANKGQLLHYFISAIDHLDFQHAIKQQKYQNEAFDAKLTVDIGKIATNFGLRVDIRPELIDVIRKKALRQELKEVFNSVLDETVLEDALLPFVPTYHRSGSKNFNFEIYNRFVENIIYDCGKESEKKALSLLSYDFVPSEYQDYSKGSGCSDGILSFRDMVGKINCNETNVLQYLSAYTALMDDGILGTRLQFSQGKNAKLVTILKAGELATFSLPRRIAIFIPAFAKAAYYSSRFGLNQKEAVDKFYKKYYESVNGAPNEYKGAFNGLFEGMCERGCLIPPPKTVAGITDKIYDCGQTYGGWNFKNMTWQTTDEAEQFQKMLLDEAELFISRNEKYWE